MEQEETVKLDFGSIDFTPDWAKKDAGVSIGKIRPEPAFEGERPRENRRPFVERERERSPYGERANRKPFGERERKDYDERDRKRDRGKSFGEHDRKPVGDRERKPFAERRPRFEEKPRPLDVEVKILPDTKALGTIIRKIQGDTHAYKLKDLAYFFLENPQSVLLKVTPKGEEKFVQCKACGFASTRQEDVIDHVLAVHLTDYFDAKEIEVEPPKGNFTCVAKCGLSGVWLGPPNIHEFNAVVKEMIRTRYPEMSEEQYRSHIEMVRDAESIEAWRKGAVKRTVFFNKGQAETEGAASFTREQAEGEFRRNILPTLIDTPKNLMITADQAMKSPVKPFVWAVRDALEAERRAPYAMCFALRGAFHHRKFHFFRANDSRGPEFVSNIEYKEFDAEHAIPELRAMAEFIEQNPCCDVNELPKEADALQHLQWLVTTGHVVSFTNGVYSKVEKFPKYGPQWKKRKAKKEAPETPAVENTVVEEGVKKDETAAVVAE